MVYLVVHVGIRCDACHQIWLRSWLVCLSTSADASLSKSHLQMALSTYTLLWSHAYAWSQSSESAASPANGIRSTWLYQTALHGHRATGSSWHCLPSWHLRPSHNVRTGYPPTPAWVRMGPDVIISLSNGNGLLVWPLFSGSWRRSCPGRPSHCLCHCLHCCYPPCWVGGCSQAGMWIWPSMAVVPCLGVGKAGQHHLVVIAVQHHVAGQFDSLVGGGAVWVHVLVSVARQPEGHGWAAAGEALLMLRGPNMTPGLPYNCGTVAMGLLGHDNGITTKPDHVALPGYEPTWPGTWPTWPGTDTCPCTTEGPGWSSSQSGPVASPSTAPRHRLDMHGVSHPAVMWQWIMSTMMYLM